MAPLMKTLIIIILAFTTSAIAQNPSFKSFNLTYFQTNGFIISQSNSGVSAATYGSSTATPVIAVDVKGRITSASASTVTPAVGSITGLGTGVATFLATPSSANLASAVTDETGRNALVFGTAPTITGGTFSGAFTNASGQVFWGEFRLTNITGNQIVMTNGNFTNSGSITTTNGFFTAGRYTLNDTDGLKHLSGQTTLDGVTGVRLRYNGGTKVVFDSAEVYAQASGYHIGKVGNPFGNGYFSGDMIATNGFNRIGYTYTASFVLTATNDIVVFDGTSLTGTLPGATTNYGKTFTIKNMNSSSLTVARTSSQTIDGVASDLSLAQYQARTIWCNGANWIIIGGF